MSGTACIVSAALPASAASQCGLSWASTLSALVMKSSLRSGAPRSTSSTPTTEASGS